MSAVNSEVQKVPEGYKQTEVGVIPDDWVVSEFGDLVNYVKGYPFKSADYISAGARIIRVSDTTFDSIKDVGAAYISESSSVQYKKWKVRTNDLIFSTVGSKPPMYDSLVGKAILVSERHAGSFLNQNAVIIRAKNFTAYFQNLLLNHFRTERYIDHIEIIYRGNANQASITLENLFQFKLPIPKNIEEQAAIANSLSDVDALITSLEKLIAKKRAIKTATMQQLLTGKKRLPPFGTGKHQSSNATNSQAPANPQNNKTTPPGYKQTELGEIPEDWEVVDLADAAEFYDGIRKPVKSGDRAKMRGTFRYYGASGVVDYVNDYLFDGAYILLGEDGENILSRNLPLAFKVEGKFWVNNHAHVMQPRKEFNIDYLAAFLESLDYSLLNSGTAQPKLNKQSCLSVRVAKPPKAEQSKISDVLLSINSEIDILMRRLNKTQQIKQGMMQELLTGRTRLI